MAAFRVVDPINTYLSADGQPLANGSLEFYETGTTTPKDVYGSKALSPNNGAVLELNSAGRASAGGVEVDVWGVGSYRVRVLDYLGVQVGPDRDDVEIPGGGGAVLPSMSGHAGELLTNNGLIALWQAFLALPDPTGQSGKAVVADGAGYILQALTIPDLPADGIENTTTTFRIGDLLVQIGSGTFAASGVQATAGTFTFPTAFNAVPVFVGIQMHGASMYLHARVDSWTATTFDASADSNIAGELIVASQTFKYLAIGPVTP